MNTTNTKAEPEPLLLQIIANCPDRESAYNEYVAASLKMKRAAAKHLGVPVKCGLYIEIVQIMSRKLRGEVAA